MKLTEWPIFKAGLFKKARYMISAPQKAQRVLEILETGTVGIESLPMETGFMKATALGLRKAWVNIHALKLQVYKNGHPTQEEAVLPISERSHKPLDPLGNLKPTETEKFASLKDIAKVRHAQARSAAVSQDKNRDMASAIIQMCFLLLAFYGVLSFVRGC